MREKRESSMRKKPRILAGILVLALCAVMLPAAVFAAAPTAENLSVVRKPTVTFVAGGEVFATVLVPYGDKLGNMPQVPEKEGFVGVWDKTVDIVTGDVTVTAFYTPISGGKRAPAFDPMWLAIPVLLMSAAAVMLTVKYKEH